MALRVGLVGFGLAGRVLHLPLIRAAGMQVEAVVPRQADALRSVLPQARCCASLEELLGIAAIDLVVIASPNHLHVGQATQALEAGKHVVVDKPLALSSAEAGNLGQLAEARMQKLAVFQNRRWDSDFLTLRSLIGGGKLGEVRLAQLRWDRFRPEVQPRWREQARFGGGVLYDLGSHLIDQALCLFGAPDWLQADVFAQRAGATVDDGAELLLAKGVVRISIGISSISAGDGCRYRVYGTDGHFTKHGLDVQEQQLRAGMAPTAPDFGAEPQSQWGRYGSGDSATDCAVPPVRGCWVEFYRKLGESIERGTAVPVAAQEARDTLRIIEAALASSRSGQRIANPLMK